VWATEIAALDGLSEARADELGAVVDGIKDVVKKAAAGGSTSAAKTKTKKAPPKKGKGRKKAKQEDEDSDDDYAE
jgi:ribosomal protein L12E/L44/L45/RPP1/RPP2